MNKKSALVVAVCVVAVALGATWALELRRFGRQSAAVEEPLVALEALAAQVADSAGKPLEVIDPEEARAFMAAAGAGTAAIEVANTALESGGSVLWGRERRRSFLGTAQGRLQHLRTVSESLRPALHALAPAMTLTSETLSNVTIRRTEVRAGLQPTTESSAMRRAAAGLDAEMRSLGALDRRLEGVADESTVDPAEGYQRAIVAGLRRQAAGAKEVVGACQAAAREAADASDQHRQQVLEIIGGRTGLMEQVQAVAERAYPASTVAAQHTRPVLQAIRDLERPIPGGQVLGIFSGEPVSPLSLMTSLDPNIKVTVETVRTVCVTIETTHRELTQIQSELDPLVRSVREVRGSAGRIELIRLAEQSPQAAAYCERKATIFDPAMAKIAQARPAIQNCRRLASSLSLPSARGVALNLATQAEVLVDGAELPFKIARQAIIDSGQALRQIEHGEAAYRSRLAELRKGPSPAAAESTAPTQAAADSVPTATYATPPQRSTPSRSNALASTGDWWVQVGAFGDPGNADRARERLGTEGESAVVAPGPKGLSRVRVGPFSSRADAELARQRLLPEWPPAKVVQRDQWG